MEPIPYARAPVAAQLSFKDKRGALIAVGVICFLVAACTGCFTLATPFAMLMPNAGAGRTLQMREMIPAAAVYLILTVVTVLLGLGAVRARRWVRPVLLAVAWGWMVSTVISGVIWLLLGPGFHAMMQASASTGQSAPPPGLVQSIAVVSVIVMAVIFLGIPTVVIWLLAPQDVRLTAEHFSPPAWSDGKPIHVVALSLMLATMSLAILIGITYPVFPLFGLVLSGPMAVAALLVLSAVLAVLALHVFRQRRWSWGATLVIVVFWSASMLVTSLRVSPIEMQRVAGRSQQDLDVMQRMGDGLQRTTIAFALTFGGLGIAYLLYVRRYFSSSDADAAAPAAAAESV
jgi:hypothetical protein